MQTFVKKALHDLEKGEQVKPGDLDHFSRDVHSKNTFILDWQIHNKKITEIENKLKDREYYRFIKNKADEEVNMINLNYAKKREDQNKYLRDLQQQEKQWKVFRKNDETKALKEYNTNKMPSVDREYSYMERPRVTSLETAGNNRRSININQTIDNIDLNPISRHIQVKSSMNKITRNMLGFGRRHKNDIPFGTKNMDQLGVILHGDEPPEIRISSKFKPITKIYR